MSKIRSFYDKKHKLFVACCECNRGGNGNADCSGGFRSKRWDKKGCFVGNLLDKHKESLK